MLVLFGPFLRHTNEMQAKQGFQRSYSNLGQGATCGEWASGCTDVK